MFLYSFKQTGVVRHTEIEKLKVICKSSYQSRTSLKEKETKVTENCFGSEKHNRTVTYTSLLLWHQLEINDLLRLISF